MIEFDNLISLLVDRRILSKEEVEEIYEGKVDYQEVV